MDILIVIVPIITIINVLILLLIWHKLSGSNNDQHEFNNLNKEIKDEMQRSRDELSVRLKETRQEQSEAFDRLSQSNLRSIKDMNDLIRQRFKDFNHQQNQIIEKSITSIKDVRTTIDKQLSSIREDNEKQLNKMRETVDEKLQSTLEKRLGESFKHVSERLEKVHKGLGEMQNVAAGVGDLKRVLSNVKTRGILGEYQLGNILEDILTAQQYSQNVATKRGSQANVEYAVKLPGAEDNDEIWLPIDSKFPTEDYQALMDAYEAGDKAATEKTQQNLIKRIETFAKDISSKYIDPPNTTDFAVMFLPVEGLYAEVLRQAGFIEKLRNQYKITVVGPSTLSAFLSSLAIGFRTLAVQKRSSEVWKILEEVKTEFGKFAGQLDKVDKQLTSASESLNHLRSTRTSVLNRKLSRVEGIEAPDQEASLLERGEPVADTR